MSFKVGDTAGERSYNSKLKEGDVLKIREMIRLKFTLKQMAESFGVSPFTIKSIKYKQRWKNV